MQNDAKLKNHNKNIYKTILKNWFESCSNFSDGCIHSTQGQTAVFVFQMSPRSMGNQGNMK